MKKLLSRMFGKLSLCSLLILLQLGWLVYVFYRASTGSEIINLIIHVLSVLLALYVVNRDIKPYYQLSWIFLILCLPIFGCTFYYLFGRGGLTRKKGRQLASVIEELAPLRQDDPTVLEALKKEDEVLQKQSRYISDCAGFPMYKDEGSCYYRCGEEAFPHMLEDLKKAQKYIFLEYFIIEKGHMFDSILAVLEEKVEQGVEVRLMYDDIGSINTVSPRFDKILQEKGIKCVRFNPFRPILAVVMNNRDHRKILVVDGVIAYTGGINLADEYINEVKRFGYWKDEAIRLEGAGAWSFSLMFLEMWNYVTGDSEDYARYQPKVSKAGNLSLQKAEKTSLGGYVQPFSDSPLDQEDVSENVYLNIVNSARRYVYIFTPYLILSWEMNRALINAAKSGIDVRIITPGVPDKRLVYMLTQANYESLIRGGVQIYQYQPGFLHAKCIVSDDRSAVVGTINLDFRSLYLHFECGVFLYRTRAVEQVCRDVRETLKESRPVSLEDCQEKNFFVQLILSILRLFSPML